MSPATHRPDVVGVTGLIVTANAAIDHPHAPSLGDVWHRRRARPIRVRELNISKRMPTGQGRIIGPIVYKANHFPHIGQSPVIMASQNKVIAGL